MAAKDVLLIVTADGRDQEWESRIVQRTRGQIEIRWQALRKPDGSFKRVHEFDQANLDGITMLYTFAPIPAGTCQRLRRQADS